MMIDVIGEVLIAFTARMISEIEADADSPYVPRECTTCCKDEECRQYVLIRAANMKIIRTAQLN